MCVSVCLSVLAGSLQCLSSSLSFQWASPINVEIFKFHRMKLWVMLLIDTSSCFGLCSLGVASQLPSRTNSYPVFQNRIRLGGSLFIFTPLLLPWILHPCTCFPVRGLQAPMKILAVQPKVLDLNCWEPGAEYAP